MAITGLPAMPYAAPCRFICGRCRASWRHRSSPGSRVWQSASPMSQWLMFSAEAQMSEKPFSDGLPEAFRRASGCFFEKSSIPEPIFRAENCGNKKIRLSLHPQQGGLAQLARALAWHARGHEFESRILHHKNGTIFRWSRFSVYVSGRIGRTRHKRHKSIRAGLHPQH